MYYKRAKVGTRVRVNERGGAYQGKEGTIVYKRGFNRDGQVILSQWVQVNWDKGGSMMFTTNQIDEVK